MQVTFFSFLMTLIWGTVLILGIYLCRKTYFFVRQFGIVSIFSLYLFTLIRTLMPVEFPFSINVNVSGIYNIFYDNIYLKKFDFMDFRLSLFDCFLTIWLSVFFFLVIRFIVDYQKTIRAVNASEIAVNEQYSDILDKVKKVTTKNVNLEIVRSKGIEIPMAMGIINKKIILPDRDFNDSELFYILLHEYVHLINHDLLVKLSVHLFCCFFWWNPVVYLLKKDLNQTLEIKCDWGVINMSYCEKAEYLKCIVNVLKARNPGLNENYMLVSTLFLENYKFDIKERFKYVAKYDSARGGAGVQNCIFSLLFVVIIGFSYLLVIQPSYEAPVSDIVESENVFEITPDIGYISINGDSYFIVYPNNEMQEVEISEELAIIMESQGFEIREENKE